MSDLAVTRRMPSRMTYEQHRSFAVWLGTRAQAHPCPICESVRWVVVHAWVPTPSPSGLVGVRCGDCAFERAFRVAEIGLDCLVESPAV